MSAVTWDGAGTDGAARIGTMETPHGPVETPNFMPVGTRGTVKTMDVEDLKTVGAQIVLANTYHLMLRPGENVVSQLGELHGFMAWDGPILTDSGGYQVLSLKPKISEEGLIFRSTYDGARVELTPERAVAVQETLGSDIAMVLDVPVPLPSSRADAEAAMHQTMRWAERALAAKRRDDRALFGIVQGGAEPDLREQSAKDIAALGFPGFGIGGLAVGETAEERDRAIDAAVPHLPQNAVRYVMGLGDTEGILAAIERGVDLFDCVIPTRLARHGKALTRTGDISIKRAEWIRRPRTARRCMHVSDLPAAQPRLPAPPVHHSRAPGTPAPHPPQSHLHVRPAPRRSRSHCGRPIRRVPRRYRASQDGGLDHFRG